MARKRKNEEETDYLVSTADLMAGLLFVFIIALALQIMLSNEEGAKAREAEAQAESIQAKAKTAEARIKAMEEEAKAAEARAKVLQDKAKTTEARAKAMQDKANTAEARAQAMQEKARAAEALAQAMQEMATAVEARTKAMQENARTAEARAEAIQLKLAGNVIARSDLLERVQKRLAARNIDVSIDPTNGVLRLPEASITFETGKATLKPEYVERLKLLRTSLENELACYHKGANKKACRKVNPYGHTLDAVFIEGHTDNQPFGGDTTGHLNRRLSTDRANTVYSILLGEGSRLRHYRNPNNQNLFSLSGYGEERPVPGHFHASPTNDPVNRRIELRFLMSTPSLEVGEK